MRRFSMLIGLIISFFFSSRWECKSAFDIYAPGRFLPECVFPGISIQDLDHALQLELQEHMLAQEKKSAID